MKQFCINLFSQLLILSLLGGSVFGDEKPDWIETGKDPKFPEIGYMTGVGLAQSTGNEAKDRESVDANAFSQITQQIKVKVKSEKVHIATEKIEEGKVSGGTDVEETTSVTEVYSIVTLQGLSIADRYYDKKTKVYYSFAVLDRRTAAGALEREINQLIDTYENSREQIEKLGNKYFQILKEYGKALESTILVNDREEILNVVRGRSSMFSTIEKPSMSESEITGKIQEILSNLKIEKFSGDNQEVRIDEPAKNPLAVHVFFSDNGERIPMQGIPLKFIFMKGSGELNKSVFTDINGKAQSNVYEIYPTGEEKNLIEANIDYFSFLDDKMASFDIWKALIEGVQTKAIFLLKVASKTLEEKITLIVLKLKNSLSEYLKNNISVIVGNFTYQDTKIGSPFILYFRDRLEVELTKHGDFQLINRNKLDLAMQKKSINYKGSKNPGSPEIMGEIVGADAVITGNYWDKDREIEINVHFIESRSGKLLASTNTDLPKNLIPSTLSTKPANFTEVMPAITQIIQPTIPAKPSTLVRPSATQTATAETAELKVDLWVDRGNGGIYKEGELMQVYFKANKDCYVRLINKDAGGNVIQLYTNKYSLNNKIAGNKTYSIPGINDSFKFKVISPFGTELLTVFACTEPFDDVQGEDLGNGLTLIRGNAADIWESYRIIKVKKRNAEFAESSCIVTTVEK